MSENYAGDDRAAIIERLGAARRLLAVTHARPDGDALGSTAALVAAARTAGRAAEVVVPDKLPDRYAFLFALQTPYGPERFAELADGADLIVLVDTGALAQLDGVADAVAARPDKTIVIDHHATGDAVGSHRWIDTSAAAAGVMIGELIEALGWPLTVPAAEALMAAVATDTGWFHYANTDARCLRAAARWLQAGVRPDRLYQRLYQNDRAQRLALMARMLGRLKLSCGGRLAVMTLGAADFEATGAKAEETENLVNEPLRIGSVDTVALLVEGPDFVRVSLRSRDAVNVAEIAQALGGGGHAAAGVRISGPLERAKRTVVAACEKALGS